ncbi:MAG: hypothetical protein HY360_21940 [Verrucomicrobia bacterium]|nr:hypothetical protein [Verrucomicrobiota bacterium]
MRLIEAILNANRAAPGKTPALLPAKEFADSLPIAALTCIDPRLNHLLPDALGVSEENFIWLRNAGNIITSPLSSTVRSIALACAVKNAREIVVLGHTDCKITKTTMMDLIGRFEALDVARACMPENLVEYFGLSASERQNVIKAADLLRHSPIISRKIPVHGLLIDMQTGRLELLVNGYESLNVATHLPSIEAARESLLGVASSLASFGTGEMKFPNFKIGESRADVAEAPAAVAPAPAGKETEEPTPPPLEHAKTTPPKLPQKLAKNKYKMTWDKSK